MIVRTKTETTYVVEMTAQQRQAIILGLVAVSENDDSAVKHYQVAILDNEQKQALNDLRQSLLNAA